MLFIARNARIVQGSGGPKRRLCPAEHKPKPAPSTPSLGQVRAAADRAAPSALTYRLTARLKILGAKFDIAVYVASLDDIARDRTCDGVRGAAVRSGCLDPDRRPFCPQLLLEPYVVRLGHVEFLCER
jgi:hypothetical protein